LNLITFTIISLVGIIIVFSLNYIIFHFDNKSFAESESESPSKSEEQSLDISPNEQSNLGGIIDIISQFIDFLRQFIESLRQLIESRPIDSLRESRCIASGLTGGTSDVKKDGNLIIGTNCDDKIDGSSSDEIIYNMGGIDQVYAKDGNDMIYGGSGDDRLYGGNGDDIITSGIGSNLLDGGPGSDILIAGIGNNLLVGGYGNDMLMGGAGTTIMYGGADMNTFDCAGLGKGIVLDYNPERGDTIAGQCKIVNNVGVYFPSHPATRPPR
jgi:RTX calcium-binding nonapeptide repeat (4 copies)